jgi:hypothetical protein
VILNRSCFAADITSGLDPHGDPYHLVVLSATFERQANGALAPASEGDPFRAADVHFGEPALSSVRYEADIAPEKTRVDVIINGSAYAPLGRSKDSVKVSVRVSDIHKELIVFGDRHRSISRRAIAGPQPFTSMPIVYERALGGTVVEGESVHFDPRNPVGVGHRSAKSGSDSVRTEVPNVMYADGRDTPAGFGSISRQWQPRLALAGTYDNRWRKSKWPLLPEDFNPAYFQAAPLDQQSGIVRGGDLVEIENMTPEGRWTFRLPILHVPLHCLYADHLEPVALKMDTVLLEPDVYRVTLKARKKISIVRKQPPLVQVIVGHASPAMLRALARGKSFWDRSGSGGRPPGSADYEL